MKKIKPLGYKVINKETGGLLILYQAKLEENSR